MIFGEPGAVIPLNLPAAAGEYRFAVPPGLPLARRISRTIFEPAHASWTFGPGATSALSRGDALLSPIPVQLVGPARFSQGMLRLDRDAFLQSGPLGLDFGASADVSSTQTPRRMRCSLRGVVPRANGVWLFAMLGWHVGSINLFTRYDSDQLACSVGRGQDMEVDLFSTALRKPGVEQLLEIEWRDMPDATGGTVTFFIDGRPAGDPLRTRIKPRITPDMAFSVNASLGNLRNAADGLLVREISVTVDRPVTRSDYQPISGGSIDGALLPDLVIDARAITSRQSLQKLAWRAPDGSVGMLDIIIGPLDVPAGTAWKAVLEDWSTGRGVAHPNALVMTRIAAQNCRFEDDWLGRAQAAWIECLPEGPVPNIAGIDYRCEAIRCANYVQFQFGYDWDAAMMPHNPFGDPTGRHSYMVPHKWLIFDRDDLLLATIETPDGGPLNGTDKPGLYNGPIDGRNCAVTSKRDRWYPHGTVRSGIIWRSGDPGSHDVDGIRAAAPLFDISVPFGSHADYSVNGFDLRIFQGGAGGDGQANGFGNVRVMPWEQSDYATLVGRAGRTRDPYGANLYSANSMAANAALWLRYTPFNIQGRSPVTGPGGVRDDRQIIAEPVAMLIDRPDGVRPHDRLPWRTIALDYLTGYVSDPVHAFEKGRNVPLFKGNARRPIVARNHYYGHGNGGVPADRAWYQQGGRISDWMAAAVPLRVRVPYAGDRADKPYFGTFQIDKAHSHQFPGWGSLLFRTPEFAFLGHRFWDQNRLYSNDMLADDAMQLWSSRDGAWTFMHAALAWKTASAASQRLYSRAEVLDFTLYEFERFHDLHYAATPGFLHPPNRLIVNGRIDLRLAAFAAARDFGIVALDGEQIYQHDFFIGYWLSALAAAEKMGFNDALRRMSAKAGAVLDWLIAMHRKRIVGRLLEGALLPPLPGNSYMTGIWSSEHIERAAGDVDRLPRSYAALETLWGRAPGWDRFVDGGGHERTRDGQAMDQLIAGPSLLRYLLRQTGEDLVAAQAVANRWRDQKKGEEMAKGDRAGSGWFVYLQATNNPARAAQHPGEAF